MYCDPSPRLGRAEESPLEADRDALVVAANRLPIEMDADGTPRRSPGGLVSALSSVSAPQSHWVGWLGPDSCDLSLPDFEAEFQADGFHPIGLTREEADDHYNGFCNSLLWPLFHGRLKPLNFERSWWRTYRAVNERFAAKVAAVAPPDARVWVHDYHLLLAPAMIRARRSDLRIGSFLHIPFPPARLFAALPWRRELLLGMLGADLLGFQTPDDVDHMLDAIGGYGGGQWRRRQGRMEVDAFPISIDFNRWASHGPPAARAAREHRASLGADFVLLGIDRLDYTKGIAQRLRAFGELLDEGLLDADRSSFVQVAVPGRTSIADYQDERAEIEEVVASVNRRHIRACGVGPIRYLTTNLGEAELAEWYRAADALVVTSLADGMNLVAKEFVACRGDVGASVILSEFAGAVNDLPGALVVNPYDTEGVKRALLTAYRMPAAERAERMTAMREQVRHHTVHDWAQTFLERLNSVGTPSATARRRPMHRGGLALGRRVTDR